MASLYRRMGDSAKADEYARAMKPIDDSLSSVQEPGPDRGSTPSAPNWSSRAGKFTEPTDLKAAIALTPQAPDLHFNLAQVYEGEGRSARIESYRAETEVAPRNFGASLNPAVYFKGGRVEEASACFRNSWS
jgi:hypothetical protein